MVHVELRILKGHNISAWIVILKDWTPVSISNPCEVATSIMIHWENGPGNCNAEGTLSNVILRLDRVNIDFRLKFYKMTNLMGVFY